MNRRQFTKLISVSGVGLCFSTSLQAHAKSHQVAITMDDFNWRANPIKLDGAERNRAILTTLRSKGVKAALFVRASNIVEDDGKNLLKVWDDEGHLIGNHTFSHLYYHNAKVTPETFSQDIVRAEDLLKSFPHFQKIFRFPYLKEGDTVAKRDAIRQFLSQRGYRVGHVTIDTSDWIVDDRLRKRLAKDESADLSGYRQFYLDHMWERALYYDELSQKIVKRSVKHTILMHFNLLNALFLGDLVDMFRSKGWQVIDAVEAFRDPVFLAQPKIVPAGESIIWALAKETGRFDKVLRYPGEDGEYETSKMDKLGL
ncbi:MAG: polysaccharide deacetylase [Acidobacteria bacterium]|nr:MAG: polysaccharide deacetylase [Acidobacteriota bacterium]